MTDQNSSERTRRTFMKGAAATGVAATGITAFGGNAAAQNQRGRPSVDIVNETVSAATGLITVQVSGVNVNALNANNVQVLINDELIDIDNIEILNAGENLVEIDLEENQILNIGAVQLTVAILGGAASTTEDVQVVEDVDN